MRGRDRERHNLLGLLAAAGAGRGAVLLVEGEPGIGKSALLAEASELAGARGLPVARGRAEEMSLPLAPLRQALGEPCPAGRRAEDALRPQVEWFGDLLAERVAAGPALVVLDDLQWADPATLVALRALRAWFADEPVGWLLARCRGVGGRQAERLFRLLEEAGADRVEPSPLDPAAVAEVVRDVLGAPASAKMLSLAAVAGGNPLLLGELLLGLRDEDAVVVRDGAAGPRRAWAASGRLPRRAREAARRRLDGLAARTRHLAETAAALGPSFSPADAAGLLGVVPAALLPAVDEAIEAGVLTATADTLAFRHELVRRAALDALPPPVRHTLEAQARHILEARTRRTLEAQPRPALSAETPEAVSARLPARNPDVRAAPPPVPAQRPGRSPGARHGSGTAADNSATPPKTADNSTAPPKTARSGVAPPKATGSGVAPAKVTERLSEDDVEAMVVLAMARWDAGRLAEGLELAERTAELAAGVRLPACRAHPGLALATMLIDICRPGEAMRVLAEADRDGAAPGAAVLRGRAELAAGRPEAAAACAEAALRADGAPPFGPLARAVLATVALRRGDLATALGHAGHDSWCAHVATAYARAGCAVMAGRVVEAAEGPGEAVARMAEVYDGLAAHRWALVSDPAAAGWLVRVALAASARDRARAVADTACELAAGNPGFPALEAAAAHARGLLEGDAHALSFAAGRGADIWARASAWEDLGVVLAEAGDQAGAVRGLDRALSCYEEAGAGRDAARVRGRQRGLGVRHRHWTTADRPVSGWDSLTETERTVSLLVSQGWRNRQIAEQMFISVHTVAFHLRQVFRKLGIASRVDLARLAVEHARGTER
ncbi:hypothetical protein Misp01_18590 [Microtetraspora sp. NBRC 13810]|uniref:LuxR C-terminal-related transcriptional regulator n=1 Tax=Microtetraspora sp. NBRC 13810 TaxID=3030990 RepID=UPI0024A2B77B|nr:AAA family ATPase [Microtetraspora sp. NBRC 13810]GLW06729.1 hypothetical protein Misp01_18590 [Microtetraspora sp. NBRC 13810]